jgi:hypothetical protein
MVRTFLVVPRDCREVHQHDASPAEWEERWVQAGEIYVPRRADARTGTFVPAGRPVRLWRPDAKPTSLEARAAPHR